MKLLCPSNGCEIKESLLEGDDGHKDEFLCDCMFDGCPVATVYAALCGFGHVRARLKTFEDAGVSIDDVYKPPKSKLPKTWSPRKDFSK